MATVSSKTHKILVLISGSGSNLQALIDASSHPSLPNSKIIRVISDRKDAYGLKRAEAAGIPTTYHGIVPYKELPDDPNSPQDSPRRKAYDADLAKLVLAEMPDLVVCAGFMRILTPACLKPLADAAISIINLHPSLHGDLVGAHCIERAWEEFKEGKRTKTGIMIHYVIAEVDKGKPIVQQEVSIVGCETLEDLQERIHKAEHELIVIGARKALEDRK